MIIVLLVIILWHLLYDFHWQGDFIAQNKGKSPLIMAIHAFTWSLGIFLLTSITLDVYPIGAFFVLFVGHYLTDLTKCRAVASYPSYSESNLSFGDTEQMYEKKRNLTFQAYLLLDQLTHLVQIVLFLLFCTGPKL